MTTRALRRERSESVDTFPADVRELQEYFQPATPGQKVRAVPGAGLNVPIWILGSSLFSAGLAASLGLPYAFASHFAPDELYRALDIYRSEFRPSERTPRPYAMACVNIFAAETDAEAARLFTSLQRQFVDLQRGSPGPVKPPVDTMDGEWSAMEAAWTNRALRESIVGSPETVRRELEAFLERTGVDELMATASIYDHAARIRSFEIVAALGK